MVSRVFRGQFPVVRALAVDSQPVETMGRGVDTRPLDSLADREGDAHILGGAEFFKGTAAVGVPGCHVLCLRTLPICGHAGWSRLLHRLYPGGGEGHTYAPGLIMALDLSHAAIIIGNFNSHLIAGHGPGRKSGHGDFNTLGAFHLAGVGSFAI